MFIILIKSSVNLNLNLNMHELYPIYNSARTSNVSIKQLFKVMSLGANACPQL